MSHYLSGILKIISIEAFMALLVIDKLTGEKWERAKHLAYSALVAVMVFGWTNWGTGRATSAGWMIGGAGVVWLCGWILRVATGKATGGARLVSTLTAVSQRTKLSNSTLAIALSGVVALTFCWAGTRGGGIEWVHSHEQFHFYLGAKYQKEVGWFDLYTAAVMADRETVNATGNVATIRDNHTFVERPIAEMMADAPRIRARFTDERWAAFKADWVTMTQLWRMNWGGVVNDHGNSNSPAWSIVAGPIANAVPLTKENQSLLGCIDLVLMLMLFLALYDTFGVRLASVAVFMWACVPVSFDYLAGSFLRWDWLFALGLAVCCLEKKRWGTAGALFGFAVASKLFPLFFGVALLIKAAWDWKAERTIKKEWILFGRNTVIAGAVCVALSTAMFGTSAWPEYAERIQVAQLEKFYSNQHSFKTVFLQTVAPGPGSVFDSGIFPPAIKQGLPDVDIKDYGFMFLVARIALTAVIALLLRKATAVEAFTLGPLLVFTWLTVNMYYWNMLALLALGLAMRSGRQYFVMLLGFFAADITYYTYQHLNRGMAEGYLIALIMLVMILAVAAWDWWDSRSAATT